MLSIVISNVTKPKNGIMYAIKEVVSTLSTYPDNSKERTDLISAFSRDKLIPIKIVDVYRLFQNYTNGNIIREN